MLGGIHYQSLYPLQDLCGGAVKAVVWDMSESLSTFNFHETITRYMADKMHQSADLIKKVCVLVKSGKEALFKANQPPGLSDGDKCY